jgi:hypothetical protein
LGRGAFGRVLLAEAHTDGQLYALKIISKKNMRSSDKRQAKAERDILVRALVCIGIDYFLLYLMGVILFGPFINAACHGTVGSASIHNRT